MNNNKKTECGLCNEKEYKVIYNGIIRDGVAGIKTTIKHKVVKCNGCGLVRLLDNPLTMEYYQSDEYRNAYNETSSPSDYIEMHDNEQPPRLDKIGADFFRDKIVLDYGCGGGAFLDLVSGLSGETLGIEPFSGYHESLIGRGHEMFSNMETAQSKYKDKVDSIVSFCVLEHVQNPQQYLKDACSLLKKSGNEKKIVSSIGAKINNPIPGLNNNPKIDSCNRADLPLTVCKDSTFDQIFKNGECAVLIYSTIR